VSSELELNLEFLEQALVSFLEEELAVSGLEGYVVGLSGGVDSAVSAALAVRAVGPERVFAYALPGPTSDPRSLADGRLVAEELGISFEVLELKPVVEPLVALVDAAEDRVRVGNLHARLRMTVLFDQAKRRRALVLGTSNKSETLLGYSTLFGDSAASVQPLGDLYKTQVWALAGRLGLPPQVVEKPPTADLWPGQSDESELGFGYREADRVLHWVHERGASRQALLDKGFPGELVDRVLRAYAGNRFKWRPTVVARISSSAVNIDRILPRNPEL
jgi:NAD+ synthase